MEWLIKQVRRFFFLWESETVLHTQSAAGACVGVSNFQLIILQASMHSLVNTVFKSRLHCLLKDPNLAELYGSSDFAVH